MRKKGHGSPSIGIEDVGGSGRRDISDLHREDVGVSLRHLLPAKGLCL